MPMRRNAAAAPSRFLRNGKGECEPCPSLGRGLLLLNESKTCRELIAARLEQRHEHACTAAIRRDCGFAPLHCERNKIFTYAPGLRASALPFCEHALDFGGLAPLRLF